MLICMQKINFVTQFFPQILQRNSKIVILGNSGMPGYIHLIWLPFGVYLQKINFILHVFLEILQSIANLLFWILWVCLAMQTKGILSSCRKLLCLSAGKKSTSPTMLFWRYCKDMQTYFGYFGYAWLPTTKMIVSTCRRLQCLSACQK